MRSSVFVTPNRFEICSVAPEAAEDDIVLFMTVMMATKTAYSFLRCAESSYDQLVILIRRSSCTYLLPVIWICGVIIFKPNDLSLSGVLIRLER